MDHFLADAPVLVEATSGGEGETLADQVREALRLVIDPELGFNIVDLGLIYDVAATQDGAVHVTMTTTTRGCPATNYLKEGSREAAGSVEGTRAVEVELTYEPPWTPQMMSPEAKSHFNMFD
ncbi:metal-sulfur cluster assembly factor [Devosia sp.]|uniref:metal-sulfur cluster assembly factor n=1 Tax=Devosia sp. TaxID=1871048 RepID=UPI002AFFD533|nr:metal-sulfur cluster assembly factor [Devosia sp.]